MNAIRRPLLLPPLLGLLAAPAAFAVDVLVPKDNALLDESRAFVVGRGSPRSEVSVSISRAGETREGAVEVRGTGAFVFSLQLEPGLNELRIGSEIRTLWVPDGGRAAPKGFVPQRLHAGGIAECGVCHAPDMGVRAGGYPGVCLTCHVIESQNPAFEGRAEDDRHFRAGVANCGRCHDPHGTTDRKLLLGPSGELCGSCHGVREVRDELHAAFEEGGCVACHDPHFSGYPAQLLGSLETVCGTCHEEVLHEGHGEELAECGGCHDPHAVMGDGLAREHLDERCEECHDGVADHASSHPALDEGCASCHQPHSSRHRGMLAASQPELCGDCHEVADTGGSGIVHEATETCTDCHGAHGGGREPYLTADLPELCLDCHGDPREEGAEVHAALDDGCLVCHAPHAGTALGMLRETETAVCTECHELAEQGPHTPEVAGEGCSCCHAPHASDGGHLLREEASTFLQNRKPCAGRPQ